MYRNISAGERTLEEKSLCIKERNEYLKANKYSTLDGGFYCFGDLIVVGDEHKEAAFYLETCLASAMNITECIDSEIETEDIYGVQIWNSIDFDLSAVVTA